MANIDINHFARSYEATTSWLATRLAMREAELETLREETQALRSGNEALIQRVSELEAASGEATSEFKDD